MEAEQRRRVLTRRRKPLSDCTNASSSSSSVSPKPSKPNPPPSSSSSKLNKSPPATTNLHNTPNPNPPSPPVLSTPSLKSSSLHGTVDVEASEPISVVYSRRAFSNRRRKDKGKEVAVPVSSAPNLKISTTRQISDGFEDENLPKAKALTVPCRKKQCAEPSKDVFKDPLVQDYIKKQNDYFKMIDEYILSEEEVDSIDELD